MSAPGKLVRSSRWKTGPSKGQRPLGSECCVVTGDSGCEAYTAIARGVGLSLGLAMKKPPANQQSFTCRRSAPNTAIFSAKSLR